MFLLLAAVAAATIGTPQIDPEFDGPSDALGGIQVVDPDNPDTGFGGPPDPDSGFNIPVDSNFGYPNER